MYMYNNYFKCCAKFSVKLNNTVKKTDKVWKGPIRVLCCYDLDLFVVRHNGKEQETAEDGMAGSQSKFQNFKAMVNQNLDIRQTDNINP